MQNKVLSSTKTLIENPKHVFINQSKVDEFAERISREDLEIPEWRGPIFPEKDGITTAEFFILANTINFKYWNDNNPNKRFRTPYKDILWEGAFAMCASFTRALEQGRPILDASYLSMMNTQEADNIFRGSPPIPMKKQRVGILKEVGEVLLEKYDGRFYNIILSSENRLFNNGKGFVERLTNDFPSFDDSVIYNGEVVRFDKRAQLAAGGLYGRFKNDFPFYVKDIDELTIFADYVVPSNMRVLGILQYNEELANKVDNRELILQGSQEELEIRASTIHAGEMLKTRVNELRKIFRKKPVNILSLDYRLWKERGKSKPHHLTLTTAY